MAKTDKCLFLVDGGGSGSRACLRTIDGQILAKNTGGPANLCTDTRQTIANLLQLKQEVYQLAGRDLAASASDYALAGLAGAGAADEGCITQARTALGFAKTYIVTDIELTLAACLGSDDGVVVMIGTGSFLVHQKDGRLQRTGGWGFELGDECGGAWLGRELLRDTIKAFDGQFAHSQLTQSVLDEFGGSPHQMIEFARCAHAKEFARLAPKLIAAYDSHDANAIKIVARAVDILIAMLGPAEKICAQRLCLTGGLGPIYQNWLPTAYQAICYPVTNGPLDGAFMLVQKKLGE
ncbi:BadF/BadG/BcrA/BcrD ATPase family protein [Maritalea porphyrae]|uniref:BadF/BadG/BcrA/BcrD ATPase family protein n=1 Tax=Maritalea porphyrae TaxID=880732 RepID=UPI0022AFEF54|nr:BadF/BadG/BcrA/BcrD ATPase family protein [Maritalea porphyrae]MCZ4274142.1 hypothetical protein [Maritalea porphyrae]